MNQICEKWPKFYDHIQDMAECGIQLQYPQIHDDDSDENLAQKFRDLNKIGIVLEYLIGYTTFLRAHICVVFKNRPSNRHLKQDELFSFLQRILGVKKRQLQYYFAYYVR